MDKLEIKRKAREFAFNNKWKIWKPYLIIWAFSMLVSITLSLLGLNGDDSLSIILSTVVELALIPATIGYEYYLINLVNNKELDVKESLLKRYTQWKIIISVSLVVGFCILGLSLLLIIPGIIYSFKTIMTTYILAENEDEKLNYKVIINQSKEMMDGHKMEYFKFMFKFFVWEFLFVLCIVFIGISFVNVVFNSIAGNAFYGNPGILFLVGMIGLLVLSISTIWVVPYMKICKIMYYQELKKIQNK